ncbi:site-specific integrase [Methylomagnum ishizawai]|uniref:site-specific integrase n=1 Tax=Methylomagnum ishizawai TaxID=1760988 RepID=UPI001FE3D142
MLRLKHYSLRTERAYMDWIKRYILFHHKNGAGNMCSRRGGCRSIRAPATTTATEPNAGATQPQISWIVSRSP